jgi:hypothetical protein
MDDDTRWRDSRRDAVEAHAAALDRQRAREIAEAQALIDDFVRELRERAVAPEQLRARVPDRRLTYRTPHVGWYIRRNRSLAIGARGEFYILDVPASLRSRLFGADVRPSDPPLTVGRGARDGESIGLADLLRQRLSWPPSTR